MPKLTGLTISQALKILSDSGLHIAAIEDLPITPKSPSPVGSTAAIAKPPAPAPLPGTVLKQSPTAATQTHTGADVRLTVAR